METIALEKTSELAAPESAADAEPSYDQLRLFEIENPLKTRFTGEFFKQIPTTSGVYWMHDNRGRLLYVGKAKNLRNRLKSYRNGSYARHSSKVRRLLLLVSSIEWEQTPTETAALLKENEFLRALKPPFNVANTKPETYLFLGHRIVCDEVTQAKHLELRLMFDLKNLPNGLRIHGAFKGIAGVRRGHAALARWLWARGQGNCEWPAVLSRQSTPLVIEVPLACDASAIEAQLDFFLSGWCALSELVLPEETPSGFMQSLWLRDQLSLVAFFGKCAKHRQLRDRVGRPLETICQRELDDLSVFARAKGEELRQSHREGSA